MIPGWVHTKYKFLKFIIDGERRRPVIHFNNNNQEEELNYWAHKELERERDGRPALFLSGVWWRFVLYLNSEMFVCLFVCYISYGLPGVAHELDQRVLFFFYILYFWLKKKITFWGSPLSGGPRVSYSLSFDLVVYFLPSSVSVVLVSLRTLSKATHSVEHQYSFL